MKSIVFFDNKTMDWYRGASQGFQNNCLVKSDMY